MEVFLPLGIYYNGTSPTLGDQSDMKVKMRVEWYDSESACVVT